MVPYRGHTGFDEEVWTEPGPPRGGRGGRVIGNAFNVEQMAVGHIIGG